MRRLALLALVLPLAACGGGSGGGKMSSTSVTAPLAAVRSAVSKTVGVGGESLKLTADVSVAGQAVTLAGNGALRTKGIHGWLKANVKVGTLAAPVDELMLGNDTYVKSPVLLSGLPHGKTWLKIDLAKLKVPAAAQLLFAENPFGVLQRLTSISGATKLGADVVDGVTTTHYRVQPSGGPVTGYDVWIGADGYIHRVRIVETNPAVSLTTDLSDFGRRVTVVAPPASQVYVSRNGSIPGLGGLTS